MGSGESVPRNIVIDKDRGVIDESAVLVLTKTDHKQKEASPQIALAGRELMSEKEFQDLKRIYDEKINALQQRNAELYGATIENFGRAIERAEDKYLNALQPPVCGESQMKLIVCLKDNKDRLLNCSQLFDDFHCCMQRYHNVRSAGKSR